MAGLTLESINCFQPRTPGLGIQHVNHQANACLDLSISFLYMSKRCSISVIYSQSNSSIFCTTIFRSPSYMKCHSSFRTIKQNKSELVSQLFSASCFLCPMTFFCYHKRHSIIQNLFQKFNISKTEHSSSEILDFQ